jgi:hypothetical protein
VLDIALALGHGGTIKHDAVCGMLTEYLQGVKFRYSRDVLFICPLMGLYFFLLLYLGWKID